MATIAEAARRAGAPTWTVSHVLDGTRRVGAGTRASMTDAMTALRLTRGAVARPLARAPTDAVGIAVPASAGSCFMGAVRAVGTACAARGQVAFLADTKTTPAGCASCRRRIGAGSTASGPRPRPTPSGAPSAPCARAASAACSWTGRPATAPTG